MKKTIGIMGICLMAAVGAQAATVVWDNSNGTYIFNEANNWNTDYVPGATAVDNAIIQSALTASNSTSFAVTTAGTDLTARGGATVDISADFTGWDILYAGNNSGHYGIYNHRAGTVGAVDVRIGAAGTPAANSAYNLSGGTLNVSDELWVRENGEFTQSGTSAANVGRVTVTAGSDYNLNGGTLKVAASGGSTVDGAVNVNGGTLSFDQGPANVTVSGSGLLTLDSGTIEATGSAASDVLALNPDVTVNGGIVNLLGQTAVNGAFKIVGDAADVDFARIAGISSGTLNFVFDATGVSQIDVAAFMSMGGMDLVVDGSAYTGGGTSFTLLTAVNNTAAFNSYSITGFGTEGVDWELVQTTGATGSDGVVLNIIPEPATLGLVAAFGGGVLFIRRMFQM